MASVRISRDPIASDSAANVPRRQWDTLMEERRRFCTQYLPKDCRNLLFFVEDGANNGWVGFGGAEAYIRRGLGLEPEMVNWAVAGLNQLSRDGAIEFEAAASIGRRTAQQLAQSDAVPALRNAKGGRPTKEEDRTRVSHSGGTSAAYLVAKLKRDAPEFADRLAAGEFRSARAAALAAGIIHETSELTKLRRAWQRATAEERESFVDFIDTDDPIYPDARIKLSRAELAEMLRPWAEEIAAFPLGVIRDVLLDEIARTDELLRREHPELFRDETATG